MPEQQQRPTEEMLKKLQGEKEKKEKSNTSSSGADSRNWIVKFGKDMAYISFFPYIWLKKLLLWLLNNQSKKPKLNKSVNINIIKSKDNVNQKNNVTTNSNRQVSFKEVDTLHSETESLEEATSEALKLNGNTSTDPLPDFTHSCNCEEVSQITKPTSGKKLTL